MNGKKRDDKDQPKTSGKQMANRVRVASRAVRRGRRLRARSSAPPPPTSDSSSEFWAPEVGRGTDSSQPPSSGSEDDFVSLDELARRAERGDHEHVDEADGDGFVSASVSARGSVNPEAPTSEVMVESARGLEPDEEPLSQADEQLEPGDVTLESPRATRAEEAMRKQLERADKAAPASEKRKPALDEPADAETSTVSEPAVAATPPESDADGASLSESLSSTPMPSSVDELTDSKLRRLDRALAAGAGVGEEVGPDSLHAKRETRRQLSDDEVARQGKLRRYVGFVLAAAAAVALVYIVKGATSEPTERASKTVVPTTARAVEKATATPPSKETAEVQDAEGAELEPVNRARFDHLNDDELIQRTLELLNDRDFEAAEQAARALVDRHPEDAFGYRCLGAALQDQLRTTEAREVYSQCVQNAKVGEVYECSALGGRGK